MNLKILFLFLFTFCHLVFSRIPTEQSPALLVVTGAPLNNDTQTVEIIDLNHPDAICEESDIFPAQIESAVGGLIENSKLIICGGLAKFGPADFRALSKCYQIEKNWHETYDLTTPRKWASGVVLNDDTLWITGGHDDHSYLLTTEFIRYDMPPTPGPDLPDEFGRHCITKFNETHALITGGYNQDGKTLFVDTSDFSFESGQTLTVPRYQHACGTFEYEGNPYVIVVGGYGFLFATKDSEILDPTRNKWVRGPALPHSCTHGSIVPTPDGKGVILLGCYQNHDPIYELKFVPSLNPISDAPFNGGWFEWVQWEKQLQVPRDDTVAMLIPDQNICG